MRKLILIYFVIVIWFSQISCKKFLEIDPPKNSLVKETVFQNNDQAISAVKGIYATMIATGFASGSSNSVTCVGGLSSDELIGYNAATIPFYENQLFSDFETLSGVYSTPYRTIYASNSILEGLEASTGVSPPVKNQLMGEALVVRAFSNFYLVNMFGPVPLQLTTDYKSTQVAFKSKVEDIYRQIIEDLKVAEFLLTDTYPSEGRVRANRSVAQALLARTYLYLMDWENAEKYADLVLSKSTVYRLVDPDAVFLPNSLETILQLIPNTNTNTQEGALFILQATPTVVSLRNSFAVNAFEIGDKRQASWIRSFTNSFGTYYYPYKYKVKSGNITSEYSMVLRVAEQYLIRAEARINQNKIDQGIADLNALRERSRVMSTPTNPNPLPPLQLTLEKESALLAVEQERKVELFTEWGHRWFDLKRTGRANTILSPIKTNWQTSDLLYPIPLVETDLNPNTR